jgi:hypothetical protein
MCQIYSPDSRALLNNARRSTLPFVRHWSHTRTPSKALSFLQISLLSTWWFRWFQPNQHWIKQSFWDAHNFTLLVGALMGISQSLRSYPVITKPSMRKILYERSMCLWHCSLLRSDQYIHALLDRFLLTCSASHTCIALVQTAFHGHRSSVYTRPSKAIHLTTCPFAFNHPREEKWVANVNVRLPYGMACDDQKGAVRQNKRKSSVVLRDGECGCGKRR